MADVVSTAGGLKVWSGHGTSWAGAQVRVLVGRGYPAFVRRDSHGFPAQSVEVRRTDAGWTATSEISPLPRWAADLVAWLDETEGEEPE